MNEANGAVLIPCLYRLEARRVSRGDYLAPPTIKSANERQLTLSTQARFLHKNKNQEFIFSY